MKKSICFVSTSAYALNYFLKSHLNALCDHHQITVCLNKNELEPSVDLSAEIRIQHFPISRKISLFTDIYCQIWLVVFFLRNRFDAVHTITPKAGLLGMFAAWLSAVPHRTHTFTGQIWVNRKGFIRTILKTADKIISMAATDLLADSASQRDFLINENICPAGAITVLGPGSICGVDLQQFRKNPAHNLKIRTEMKIKPNNLVFLFLGRLVEDKGVFVLIDAFIKLAKENPNVFLMLVGPDEDNQRLTIERRLQAVKGSYAITGTTSEPEAFMNAANVLCLPSFREGFGGVVIEAGAIGLPALATRIYGLTDAVIENQTGLFSAPGDVQGLLDNMRRMTDDSIRRPMGDQAQRHVTRTFNSQILTAAWLDYYQKKLVPVEPSRLGEKS